MTEDDRELLELAAKAAGFKIARLSDDQNALLLVGEQEPWTPLTDDGDGARMEAALGMCVKWHQDRVRVFRLDQTFLDAACYYSDVAGDKQAARRRAALLCAAEIGKAMKEKTNG